MKSRLLPPGLLFVTALVVVILAIPFARALSSQPHNEGLSQAFAGRRD